MFKNTIGGMAITLFAMGNLANGTAMAQTVTKYFCAESDNNWGTNNNWEDAEACNGATLSKPDSDDVAIIVAGKTCNVNLADATVGHIEVRSTATLNIDAGSSGNDRVLTITGEGSGGTASDVDGTLKLAGAYSKLKFSSNIHTLSGDGTITGQNDLATIDLTASGISLTSQVCIEGEMQIIGFDDANVFDNRNTIDANRDGVLLFDNLALADTGTAVWKVSVPAFGGTPILRLDQEYVGTSQITALAGDFEIRAGQLDLQSSIETVGTIFHYGGKLTTGPNETAIFNHAPNSDEVCDGCYADYE